MKSMDDSAQSQGRAVLAQMSPASIDKLLQGIEAGRLEGSLYSGQCPGYFADDGQVRFYQQDENSDEPGELMPFEAFNGCLIGWAAFLEHKHYQAIIAGIDLVGSIEDFVRNISLGDTPETNPAARELWEFVKSYQSKEKEVQYA